MSRTVLHVLIEAIPKRSSVFTKDRAVIGVTILAQLLTFIVTKRPALNPLQQLMTTLLGPVDERIEPPPEALSDITPDIQRGMLKKLKVLRSQLATADEATKSHLKIQIEALTDIITESVA